MTNITRNNGALNVLLGSKTSQHVNRRWALFASYACLVVFVIFFLCPPFYMLVTSLKTNAEIANLATNPWLIEQGVTTEHYTHLLNETAFLTYFKNTVIVAFFVVAITMVVSVLAAYALSRLGFWGSGVIATGVFLVYLVPDSLLFIPLLGIGVGIPSTDSPILHLDYDRVFCLHSERT